MEKLNLNNLEDILLYLHNNIVTEVPCPCLDMTEIIYDNTEKEIPLVDENGEPYLFDDLVEITGITKATNSGKYSVTISLKNPYNSMWKEYENAEVADNIAVSAIPENKKDSITIEWEIKKADITTTVDKTSIIIDLDNITPTITLSNFNWDIVDNCTIVSNNTTICNIASIKNPDRTNPTLPIEIYSTGKKGTTTISIKWTGMENYNDKEIIINVDASDMPDPVLNNNTPDIIQKTAKAGLAPNYWSVGDKVGILLKGTANSLTINDTYYAFILGFNHNSDIEGNNTIHFQFGKNVDGKDIAFVDNQYNNENNLDDVFNMNSNNAASGWENSEMRLFLGIRFFRIFPADWRKIIPLSPKYSANIGGSDIASYVRKTSERVWLLSEFEVFGIQSYANSAEQNYQKQYDYYKNGNSKIKYKYDNILTACYWWLRSVYALSITDFCCVHSNGSISTNAASVSLGLAPAFIVA